MTPIKFKHLSFFIILALLGWSENASGQTALNAGDIAVIGFKTNTSTQGGNDAAKLVTLVDLECGTTFIVTDNNWRNTGTWYCNNDEFAVEITVNSEVKAGSVIYIDADSPGNPVSVSSGAISRVDLGGNWGTNCGFNSKGDNLLILQGTRNAPQFIFAFRHRDPFSSGGDCGSKNNTSLPTNLTLGTSAIEMSNNEDQWHYDCPNELVTGTRAQLLASICNNGNWTLNGGQSWNASTCSFFVTDAPISGILSVSGSGCGCFAGCNLSSFGGPDCGSGIGGNCSAGELTMSTDIDVPNGCTYEVYATMRPWNGCTASGGDGGDQLKVDILGGSKSFQTGAGNATLQDAYMLTGPGTIRVSGSANRADEVIVYKTSIVSAGTCSNCAIVVLPVELTAFTAARVNDAVQLRWATASELNSDYFLLEKSQNGSTWESVSTLKASGNSTSQIQYTVWDVSPFYGLSYYRLTEFDYDGTPSETLFAKVLFSNNADRTVIRRINLLGQEVDRYYEGVVILYYDNGDTERIVNQ